MPRALVIGGTGLIGRAAARRLLGAGWGVTVTGRDPANLPTDIAAAGGQFLAAARDDGDALRRALGDGADLLLDTICYTADEADLLVPLMRSAASTVVISSRAVYADAQGRHGNSREPPQFDAPIAETQPTVPPRRDLPVDDAEGYAANKVAAEQVVLDSGFPVSVLRPGKVHGQAARPPREWFWVKRALDARPAVLLAGRGEYRVRPSAAANIAALVEVCATRPGRRILNAGDPDCPTTLEISRVVANHLGHDREEVLLDESAPAGLGATPWDGGRNVPLDLTACYALGYEPAGDYATTVAEELDWLTAIAVRSVEGAALPAYADSDFFDDLFDYAAEDRYLATYGS
jgi:nucleoside-diphosphate-sugar epimerase